MKNCLAVFPLNGASLYYLSGIIRYFTEIEELPFLLHLRDPQGQFTVDMIQGAKYDGFILPVRGSKKVNRALAASNKPTVLVNVNDPVLSARTRNVTSVWIDNFDMGRTGAEHFLSQGDFASFGFIQLSNTEGDLFYSHERESAFRSTLKGKGFTSSSFPGPDGDTSDAALTSWIRGLPKPAAIMAAYDVLAVKALNCCARAHLSVPGQVAILGVDNIPSQTTGEGRSLSSIKPDFAKVGYVAAKELVRMLSGKPSDKPKEIVIAACELIARNSTRPPLARSKLVENAMAYIERNADRDLDPDEVATRLGRTRRLLDLRFREICGKTMKAAILEARMRLVASALRDRTKSVKQITKDLHFSSSDYLYSIFKRHFGRTIKDFRKDRLTFCQT